MGIEEARDVREARRRIRKCIMAVVDGLARGNMGCCREGGDSWYVFLVEESGEVVEGSGRGWIGRPVTRSPGWSDAV